MPLHHKDFVPATVSKSLFKAQYETLSETIARANAWLAESGVQALNVETVVLPSIEVSQESTEAGVFSSGENGARWHQIVRIWHAGGNS